MSLPRVAARVALSVVVASGVAAPNLAATAAPVAGMGQATIPQLQPRVAASWDDTLYEIGQISVSSGGGVPANPASVAIDADDDTVYVANSAMGTVEVIAPGQSAGVTSAVTSVTPPNGSDVGNVGLFGIAVDADDDTVYVVDRGVDPKRLWSINGRTMTVSRSAQLPCNASQHNDRAYRFIAVNSTDDTVYVPCNPPDADTRARIVTVNGRSLDDSTAYTSASSFAVGGIEVGPVDDTVYAAGWWGGAEVQVLAGTPLALRSSLTGTLDRPQGTAALDDTLYVANWSIQSLAAFNPARGTSSSFPLPGVESTDVAVNASRKILVVPSNSGNVWVLTPNSGLQQTLSTPGFRASSAVVARSGLVYVGSNASDSGKQVIKVLAPWALITSVSGTAGYDQVAVSWSGGQGSPWYRVTASPGGATCLAQAPSTTCIVGGLTAGTPYTFTVQPMNDLSQWVTASSPSSAVTPLAPPSPAPAPGPAPAPLIVPGVPLNAAATPGDARARVTWSPPTYAGSGSVTGYRVTAAPGGETCYVDAPKTACTVHDLVNGTAYAFTVQALNEAGWGPGALTSPVTPQGPPVYSIDLDAGERVAGGANDRVSTTGTTTGIPSGARLTPYVRTSRSGEYKAGEATITVQADGSFAWTRYVRKSKPLYAYMRYEDARSNTVVWVRLGTSSRMAGR